MVEVVKTTRYVNKNSVYGITTPTTIRNSSTLNIIAQNNTTSGALPVSYIFEWSVASNYYKPYDSKTAAGGANSVGKFYLGTDYPTSQTYTLNYDSIFRATLLGSNGLDLNPITANVGGDYTIWYNSDFDQLYIGATPIAGTANFVDDILEAVTDSSGSYYQPYASKQTGVHFYLGTTAPDGTDRLNLNALLYATSHIGISTVGIPIYGNATSFDAVYGYSQSGKGVNGYSITGNAIYGDTSSGVAGYFKQGGSVTTSNNVVYITRTNTGSADVTGNLLSILDNPTTSGTISGKLLTATIGSTERLFLNPRVTDGASAVAYMTDTHNALSTAGAKLWQYKNQGSEKAYITNYGKYYFTVGSSTIFSSTGGLLKNFNSDVTTVTTGEEDLYTYTIPANVFATDKDTVIFEINVTYPGSANGLLRAYFAGTNLGLIGTTSGNKNAILKIVVSRVSSSTARAFAGAIGLDGNFVVQADLTSLDFTSTNIIKFTAENATGYCTAKSGYIQYFPAGLN